MTSGIHHHTQATVAGRRLLLAGRRLLLAGRRLLLAGVLLVGVLLAGAVLSGCREDSEEPAVTAVELRDFMTLVSNDASGMVLECQRTQGAPVLTFTVPGKSIEDGDKNIGKRYMVTYQMAPQAIDASGQIAVSWMYQAFGDIAAPSDAADMHPMAIRVYTLYRTGKYLNMMAMVPKDDRAVEMSLWPDQAPHDGTWPMQLTYRLKGAPQGTMAWMTIYCSWDVAEYLTASSLTINVDNERGVDTFVIDGGQ